MTKVLHSIMRVFGVFSVSFGLYATEGLYMAAVLWRRRFDAWRQCCVGGILMHGGSVV